MSKEIRELAAQMIFAIDCEDEEIPEIDGLGAIEVMEHFRDIADAYLAEHPADDDEPVTEEWLRTAGFKKCPWGEYIGAENGIEINHRPQMKEYPWTIHDDDEDAIYLNPGPQTRSDVRRLCKALGVELKS